VSASPRRPPASGRGSEDGGGGAAALGGVVLRIGGDLVQGLDGEGSRLGGAEVRLRFGEVGGCFEVGLNGGIGEDVKEIDEVDLE